MEEKDTHATTAAQRKATEKYHGQFERTNARYPKGTQERVKKLGYSSINKFINLAIMEKLEREEKYLK